MAHKSLPTFVWFVFLILCLVWGTTYLGIKIAVQYFPPFWFSGFRHLSAGLIFLILYFFTSRKMPSLSDIKHSAIAGLLMISGGNALLTWAVEYISSGLAGILSATAPLYITFLSIYFFKGFRITWVIIGGLILSIGGIILLSKPENGLAMSPQFWTGFWLTISANLSWAMGTIYMKKHPIDQHVYLKTAMQMIPAALFNFVVSGFFERMPNLQAVKADGWWATIYLIFIGSLVGYTSFVYLIKHMSPARLSIHVYVNTLVAVILGWLLGGDHLTAWTWGAMLVVITGVFIVNNQYAKMAKVV